MARAGIEDDIDSLQGQGCARSGGDPGILANLEADPDIANLEKDVADGVAAAQDFDCRPHLLGPGLEPARFVVNAVACQEPFGHKAQNPAIGRDTDNVEQGVLEHQRQAECDHHSPGFGNQLLQDGQSRTLDSRRMKGIFAAVTGDAKFRQTENACALGSRLLDGFADARLIARPIERELI